MFRYKLTLSYDGTRYFGWQKTRMGPSIQEMLQDAIRQITQEAPLPEGASRTDRGVHAAAQAVSIDLVNNWEPGPLQRALNAVLPQDIRVHSAGRAESSFHPTLDALEKEYRYRVCLGIQDPVHRLYSWAFRFPLDLERMRGEAIHFLGTRDFSAFANSGWGRCPHTPTQGLASLGNLCNGFAKGESTLPGLRAGPCLNQAKDDPVCSIRCVSIEPLEEERLEIRVTGNRFLYKMMRNIAGTLLYVGCGKLPAGSVPSIFASKDRTRAGVTAPAHGLILYRVDYLR